MNSFSLLSLSFFLLVIETFRIAADQISEDQKSLKERDVVLGQPDAGDWGGLYIEYKSGFVRRYRLIDQKKNNIPSYLLNFDNAINSRLSILSNL